MKNEENLFLMNLSKPENFGENVMTTYLNIKMNQIKNIKSLEIEIPLEKGLYSIVGSNGSGKSTIMLALSQLVRKSSLNKLTPLDFNNESFVSFRFDNQQKEDLWLYNPNNKKWMVKGHSPELHFDGFYEGSIFYGTRFYDAARAESLLSDLKGMNDIVDADGFIIEKLSTIMHGHGNKDYYKNLKRIRNREVARRMNFKGIPYFYETENGFISQLAMSSGECMLITLLHFVNNVLVRGNYKKGDKVIFLIDEVELALHPKAINRLITFMEELIREYDLVTIFSSHSPEVIRRIKPKNIFQIENNEGIIEVNNPCYPSYAIRDLYTEDGFDYLILVEDELAKKFVNSIILKNNYVKSKLIHVLPAGSWYNSLRLQDDIIKNGILGVGKKVISILDGDVVSAVNDQENFSHLVKTFLPIKSIEKHLYSELIDKPNREFKRIIGDKYFRVRSLSEIIDDYKMNYDYSKDKNGKKFYSMLTSNLHKVGISEEQFLNYLCEDLLQLIDAKPFEKQLEKLLS